MELFHEQTENKPMNLPVWGIKDIQMDQERSEHCSGEVLRV
jgi:hypothetical protein